MLTRLDPGLSPDAAHPVKPQAPSSAPGSAGSPRPCASGPRAIASPCFDRLDSPGGRGSCLMRDGHRFDLGPTIVTVPQGLRELWAACGRDFDEDVDLRPLDPFYEVRWPDGSRFAARQDPRRCAPRWRGSQPARSRGL